MIGLELLIDFYVTMSGQNFSYKFPQQCAGYQLVATVITASYPFYFVVVPRETSNLSEVRFGEVAALKQISVQHRKNL
jgi:hypothetical protein